MNIDLLRKDIRRFLAEDIGYRDVTSEPIFSADHSGKAIFVAKQNFVAAGIDLIAPLVFNLRNSAIVCSSAVRDGDPVSAGAVLLEVGGPIRDLLGAERVALNLAQRLSGIATLTRKYVNEVAGLPVKIVDTRKTTPGLRMVEKYAVRAGGGHNHRYNLADGVLIKDNHIAACGSITSAVEKIRAAVPHTLRIEVEVESLEQLEEALSCGVEIIMLDNMEPGIMREAVNKTKGKAILEASGGVTLKNVRAIAETGVDLISVGALTHSAPAVDISMRIV
jgi:nicotinate-nucleotide pyrophosphorylase (carboxylating)